MNVEILSVGNQLSSDKNEEIKKRLEEQDYILSGVTYAAAKSSNIKAAVCEISAKESRPDAVIVADALSSEDSTSFRKLFADTVAYAEHNANKPADKEYWKKRNNAFKEAKKRKADKEELEQLKGEFKLVRKKMKIFDLGDFGNGYKGYCFMYEGVKIGVLPKSELAGRETGDMVSLALLRINDVFEKTAQEYPDGFSCTEYLPVRDNFVSRFIPQRGDGGREITRKCVVIASFLVFLTAVSLLLYNVVFLSMRNSQLNGEIQKIAHINQTQSGDDKPQIDDNINWDKLKKINKEIVGWIKLDKTKIDYPVLWHKEDNRDYQYYLSHNYKGNYDSYGSIFLDYRCTKGTQSKNTVMHGHHMNDGSMFGALLKYGSTS